MEPATRPVPPTPATQSQRRGTAEWQLLRQIFKILFYLQLALVALLAAVLTVRGFLSARSHHFHPLKWYPPLLTSTGCAGIVALSWHFLIERDPIKAFKVAFWLSPLLTIAFGALLLLIESTVVLPVGVVAIIAGLAQSFYGCWVNDRFDYATKLLWVATTYPPTQTSCLVSLAVIGSVLYSGFLVCGIGGATTTATSWDDGFIFVILLSLTWTMHVVKNTLQVMIARLKYMEFARGQNLDTCAACRDSIKNMIGSVCIGSALVPIFGTIRGFARSLKSLVGDRDEMLMPCTGCCSGIASRLIMFGNRWGFVHVGAFNKGFVQASRDTWELFKTQGLVPLIDSDLTGVFCFFCGLTGGGISALVGGSWALIVHRRYAAEVALYAFLIGYFMVRASIAWAQASVSAYYVAYAENPQNHRLDSTIPVRLVEMERARLARLNRPRSPRRELVEQLEGNEN